MFESLKDYLGFEKKIRRNGVLFTYPGRIQEGKEEIQRIARKTHVSLTIKEKEIQGRSVQITWNGSATPKNMKLFKDMLSISDCFELVDFSD